MAQLTPKQIKFAHEYLIDLNGAKAAIRAGYSKKGAKQQASQLLTNIDLKAYIEAEKIKQTNKAGITAERVLAEYEKLAFFDIRKAYKADGTLIPIHQLDNDTAAAIIGIESSEEVYRNKKRGTVNKVKFLDKNRALDALAKHLGLNKEDNDQRAPIVNIALTHEEVQEYNKTLEEDF